MAENVDKIRSSELENLIARYQKSYYDGEGEISDADFDRLWDELKRLDPDNAVLHRVGADSGNFDKVRHIMPMGSQEKAADPQQFLAWADKHRYDQYLVEYKLDGASLELQYEGGHLVRAVTRGDGTVGDDITANARKMRGVAHSILKDGALVPFTGGIRGEVIMTHSVHKEHFPDKANCRNAANGIMKRKDGQGSEYLTLIVYDALSTDGRTFFTNEEEKIRWLMDCGFNTVRLVICKSADRVIAYRAKVMEERRSLEYDIDGLVIKERTINLEDASRARPDRQIAFKFSLEEEVSTLREVEWSQSGATYTPVAIFDEVELNGTKVRRASLANPDTMRKLGVRIGSHVVVVKRGEIIPKIESVIEEKGIATSEIDFPHHCETCGAALVDEGSRLYCPNKSCPKRVLHQLYKFQQVVDIRDLGETLIASLFSDGRLKSISDIYSLSVDDLVPYFLNEESMEAEKKSLGAQKVYNSIQSHRKMKLATFVAGFDIEGIGETSAQKLVDAGFSTLDGLLSASADQISGVYGFADIMARTIVEGLSENAGEMRALVDSGIIQLESEAGGILAGKSFCFTGELRTMKRSEAEQRVRQCGGSIKSSVTKDLTYLVTNDKESGSSKNLKAQKFAVPVIDEDEFLALLEG
ncbi:MAG: NAD-dependent DNA ligase LigA [Treponema sp.]|nr:NAD-dependent DNA ligase LigA [Treponema sp.]